MAIAPAHTSESSIAEGLQVKAPGVKFSHPASDFHRIDLGATDLALLHLEHLVLSATVGQLAAMLGYSWRRAPEFNCVVRQIDVWVSSAVGLAAAPAVLKRTW